MIFHPAHLTVPKTSLIQSAKNTVVNTKALKGLVGVRMKPPVKLTVRAILLIQNVNNIVVNMVDSVGQVDVAM